MTIFAVVVWLYCELIKVRQHAARRWVQSINKHKKGDRRAGSNLMYCYINFVSHKAAVDVDLENKLLKSKLLSNGSTSSSFDHVLVAPNRRARELLAVYSDRNDEASAVERATGGYSVAHAW